MKKFRPALVLYAESINRTVAFYESLGLRFKTEKHGDGPEHAAADFGGFVLEVYPETKKPGRRASRPRLPAGRQGQRLILHIEKLDYVLTTLRLIGVPLTIPKTGATVLVADPDGREVLLIRA